MSLRLERGARTGGWRTGALVRAEIGARRFGPVAAVTGRLRPVAVLLARGGAVEVLGPDGARLDRDALEREHAGAARLIAAFAEP